MVATVAATVFDAIPLLPTSLSGNRILHRHSTTILGGKLVLIVVIIGIVAVIYSICQTSNLFLVGSNVLLTCCSFNIQRSCITTISQSVGKSPKNLHKDQNIKKTVVMQDLLLLIFWMMTLKRRRVQCSMTRTQEQSWQIPANSVAGVYYLPDGIEDTQHECQKCKDVELIALSGMVLTL